MGVQKHLLIVALLLLYSFLQHCYGNAEALQFHKTCHPTDFSARTSVAGKVGYWPRRALLASTSKVVNVNDYGAKGDGSSDDTKAFTNAWTAACSSSVAVTLLVPESKTYLLKPITFSGSCKSDVTVKVKGAILASPKLSDWSGTNRKHWIMFDGVKNLMVEGGGTFDGNGQTWWKNSCKVNKALPCTDAPTAVTFDSCSSLKVDNLKFKNSQKMHVSFERCTNVQVSNLVISALGTSPNTDGIHVTKTTNIRISIVSLEQVMIASPSLVVLNTSMLPTYFVDQDMESGSIGSLGVDGSEATVSDVLVDTAQLEGSTNGVRIKTWQGGKGYAKNINFRNIHMNNVKNPIIIDQNYCDSGKPCSEQKSAVAISGVTYKNITGTSATSVAMEFDCSKSVPCSGIVLQDIKLTLTGGGSAKSTCNNVKLSKSGIVIPSPACTS